MKALASVVWLPLAFTLPASANEAGKSPVLPAFIQAQYNISLTGFDLGTFEFEQRSGAGAYSVKSVVELSALLGAFEWRGVTHTSGKYMASRTQPERYAFDYRSKGNGGMIRMDFENGDVTAMAAFPNNPEGAGFIPLKRDHTKSVLDPLTAILTIVKAREENVCGRQFPIFDGKQRFNLKLNFRRLETVPAPRPGMPALRGTVCQVKYSPVGGYTPNSQTKSFAEEKDIEIAFHPLPDTDVMVPYRISLPTIVGTAKLELKRLHVVPARDRIAAVR